MNSTTAGTQVKDVAARRRESFLVGRIRYDLTGEDLEGAAPLPKGYAAFVSDLNESEAPDAAGSREMRDRVEIYSSEGLLHPIQGGVVATGMQNGWEFHRSGDELTLILRTQFGTPWRSATHTLGTRRWDVRTSKDLTFLPQGCLRPHPLCFPLFDVVALHHLCRSGELLVHACGVLDQGMGRLFVGASGAGKSTTARLFANAQSTVLNDDRSLVSLGTDGGAMVWGTPWHGDHPDVHAGPAPLKQLMFLHQAPENCMLELTPRDACRRLLKAAWQPIWDPDVGLKEMWSRCMELTHRVPCAQLNFRPTAALPKFTRERSISL